MSEKKESEFKSLNRGGYGSKRIKEKHQSFGQLGFFRSTGGSSVLYGSSIKHTNRIVLEISHSEKHRDLNQNYYYPRQEIIRVAMSPTQFAEAISTMGSSPIPVTIERLNGKSMPPCPSENTRQKFKDEFKRDMEQLTDDVTDDFALAEEILTRKGPIKVSDRQAIAGVLRRIKMQIESNVPFIHSQFDRATDKTVTEAKGEIEAFYENKIRSLGIQAAQENGFLPTEAPDLQLDAPGMERTPVIEIKKEGDDE